MNMNREDIPEQDWHDWRWQYKNCIRTIGQLAALPRYSPSSRASYENLLHSYPMSVTPYYFSLIDIHDRDDPIGKQCLPDLQEIDFPFDGEADPFGEEAGMPVPGIVQRYPDRCLAIVTNACVTYCRHCNRKRRWGTGAGAASKEELQAMIDYISGQPGIREVIISGGDPLTLDFNLLDWFLGELRSLSHVEILRLGSRFPVVMPMGITKRLCSMLHKHRPLWFNTQFNHTREITKEAARACELILEKGIPLSNQSVLLKGINDTYEEMRSLLYALQRIGVRPYYLFHCDPVSGTGHFHADMKRGVEIMEKLRRSISGLCLPRYVLDTPGEMGKIPLGPFREI